MVITASKEFIKYQVYAVCVIIAQKSMEVLKRN